MSGDERADAGFGQDIGADSAGGYDTDVGGSTSGGDAGDAGVTGDAKTERTGKPATPTDKSPDEVEGATEGTPDDLALGTRRTVGVDEDSGAGGAGPAG